MGTTAEERGQYFFAFVVFVTRGSVIVVNINDDDEPRRRAKRAGVLPVLKTRLARSLTLILVLDDLALLR